MSTIRRCAMNGGASGSHETPTGAGSSIQYPAPQYRCRVHRWFACACIADRLRAETGLLNVELRPSGLILNVAGVARMLHMLPAWYAVASVLFTMPYAWAGGKLRERQLEHRGAVAPAIA